MILWLIEFALVILQLLMFKVYGNFGISKIEFFKFSNNENLKQNQKSDITFQVLVRKSKFVF